MADPRIRLARVDEIATVQDVERRAVIRFVEAGHTDIARLPVVDTTTHTTAIAGERLFVVDDGGPPLGFVLVESFSDGVHVWEIDVVPEAAGRGLGRMLLDHVAAWGRERGAPRVTLTTFRDIPFNAPYYVRRGFHILDEPLSPRLAAVRKHERDVGIELVPRVAMARDLD